MSEPTKQPDYSFAIITVAIITAFVTLTLTGHESVVMYLGIAVIFALMVL